MNLKTAVAPRRHGGWEKIKEFFEVLAIPGSMNAHPRFLLSLCLRVSVVNAFSRLNKQLLILIMAIVTTYASAALAGDTLADAQKRGVLVVGCKDSLPPFGYIDEKSRQIVGYDIDFAAAIARKMGVRLELKPVTSASRMPQLQEGHIDIIAATMTKNAERAKVIDFSNSYFITGQKFISRKGSVTSLKDLENKRIGTAKGSTSEQNVKKALPSATVLSFDDYPNAFLALQQGKVAAITTDETILAGILAKAPDRELYEIPQLQISDEPYGLGMRKGDANFVAFVNTTLLEMEKSGEAARIFEKWFGPGSQFHLTRSFKITAENSRADHPILGYRFDWSIITSGQYFDWLLTGLVMTLKLSAISIVLSFLLGLLIAVMRMANVKPVRWLALAYLEFFRNTPLLVQLFFWYFGSFKLLPAVINNRLNESGFEFAAAVIALTIYTSAFIAEDIRSGVLSIPKEQMEAARSAGFSYLRSMQYIILPQAIRITIPPLVNQFLNLAKNSSLAMTIGVMEMTYQARQVESYTLKGFEAFTAATVVYLLLSLIITALVNLYNDKVLSIHKAT